MSAVKIPSHTRDRFYQRYMVELTPTIMEELRGLVAQSTTREQDAFLPGRERVWVNWRGHSVGLVWSPRERFIVTFLPPTARIGQRRPRRGGRR